MAFLGPSIFEDANSRELDADLKFFRYPNLSFFVPFVDELLGSVVSLGRLVVLWAVGISSNRPCYALGTWL
ncbi:unnamed protein product [Acidithrix sp. C25]|nr:unnamed protein product [Acidithrix sp. C25]